MKGFSFIQLQYKGVQLIPVPGFIPGIVFHLKAIDFKSCSQILRPLLLYNSSLPPSYSSLLNDDPRWLFAVIDKNDNYEIYYFNDKIISFNRILLAFIFRLR